jgi:hypothetical protein
LENINVYRLSKRSIKLDVASQIILRMDKISK